MQAKLIKIQARTDYVDEVYKVLLDAISEGSLAPGTRITQEEIAEQLAVSRSPVLQALRLLKKDGLVQDAPGRGLLVAPLDVEWIGHLYEIRGALDSLAARLAAEKSARIDKRLIADGRKAARGSDVKAMIEADGNFHMAIYMASGNPLIAETARMHWVHLRRVMGAVLQVSAQRRAIWDEHAAIAAAIAQGAVALAGELSEQHASRARTNLVQRLGEVLGAASDGAHGEDRADDLHAG
ncbi:GntR family transcriptional regulator [Robbsia sp. Bb-Pol-6]|uniref:GntR family transcriptional regulator n=1 Tax=Robbsia betulipollinis TaxID=2981849 RepID=A0ABT3ZKD0_9BURK|nr:GntR family transcriptional regulator [Robbsia betulipollinis]MCY0386996.1 GntR family transcriptional regulator [Robbsia betulipollinis]